MPFRLKASRSPTTVKSFFSRLTYSFLYCELVTTSGELALPYTKLHIRKRDGDNASLVAATILNWFTDDLIQTWSFFVDLSNYLLVRRIDHTDFAQFSFWSWRCKPAEHAH